MEDKIKNMQTLRDSVKSQTRQSIIDKNIPQEENLLMNVEEDLQLPIPGARERINSVTSICSSAGDFNSARKRKRGMESYEEELYHVEMVRTISKDLEIFLEDKQRKNARVSKELYREILEYFERIQEISVKLALDNAYLKGRMSLESAPENKEKINKKANYSEIVKRNLPPITGPKGKRNVPEKKFSVMIRPKDPENKIEHDKLKKIIIETIKPVEEKIKINNIKRMRNGNVSIEAATREDLEKVMDKGKLQGKGLEAIEFKNRKPRIIIYDVAKDYDQDKVKEAMLQQNKEIFEGIDEEKIRNGIKLLFKTGRREKETVNWVMETDPDLRHILRNEGRLYIGSYRCKINDFISISRCYKCQEMGHVAKYCKAEKDICGHCAEEGHKMGECKKKKENRKCASCKKSGKKYDHEANKECPNYKAAIEGLRNKIDYG